MSSEGFLIRGWTIPCLCDTEKTLFKWHLYNCHNGRRKKIATLLHQPRRYWIQVTLLAWHTLNSLGHFTKSVDVELLPLSLDNNRWTWLSRMNRRCWLLLVNDHPKMAIRPSQIQTLLFWVITTSNVSGMCRACDMLNQICTVKDLTEGWCWRCQKIVQVNVHITNNYNQSSKYRQELDNISKFVEKIEFTVELPGW